jgi:hypothetical protein
MTKKHDGYRIGPSLTGYAETRYYSPQRLFTSTLTFTALSLAAFYAVSGTLICGPSIAAVTTLTASSFGFLRRIGVFVCVISSHHAMYNTDVPCFE